MDARTQTCAGDETWVMKGTSRDADIQLVLAWRLRSCCSAINWLSLPSCACATAAAAVTAATAAAVGLFAEFFTKCPSLGLC